MIKRTTAIAVATLLILTACASEEEPAVTAPTAGTNRPTEAPEPTETQAPEPTMEAAVEPTMEAEVEPTMEAEVEPEVDAPGASLFKFGQTKTYRAADSLENVSAASEPLLTLTVEAPEPFNYSYPEEYPDAEFVSFDVTVVNAGSEPYDPSGFYSTAQSANVEASEVFDFENLSGSPSTTLLPGREAKFTIGYAVADPEDIVLEVEPSFDSSSVIFTN